MFLRRIQNYRMPVSISTAIKLSIIFLLFAGWLEATYAETVDDRYPGLTADLLASAVLVPLDDETLLITEDLTITRSQLLEGIEKQEPRLSEQLKKNLFFVLEQEAVRQILLGEARKAGVVIGNGDDQQVIQGLFVHHTRSLTVSEEEARAFYTSNKEMVGGASFEQVVDSIRQYLLQDKKQQAVSDYIGTLGSTHQIRINEKWTEAQTRIALDNPVDKARCSGKPTMVEFGAIGCGPCDMMQPILDKLRKNHPETLNVVFVHVREKQILAARFGIRSIPVQVFYDAKGKEVFRHVGFFAQNEVNKQLAAMGVRK